MRENWQIVATLVFAFLVFIVEVIRDNGGVSGTRQHRGARGRRVRRGCRRRQYLLVVKGALSLDALGL